MLATTRRTDRLKKTSRKYRRLGVNAAFLSDVKEDEQEVSQVMIAVTRRLECSYLDRFATAELLVLMNRLDRAMEHRFCLEEFVGYMEDVKHIAPQLREDAESLLHDHRPLLDQLEQVLRLARRRFATGETCDRELQAVREAFAGFRDQYNAHEARESDLIIDLLYFDVGGEG